MTKFTSYAPLILVAAIAYGGYCQPTSENKPVKVEEKRSNRLVADSSDIDNQIFPYELDQRARPTFVIGPSSPGLGSNLESIGEREIESRAEDTAASQASDTREQITPAEVLVKRAGPVYPDPAKDGRSNMDAFKSIAFNSREVRLVGPDQKEVEMKDDVATKMMIALDNLQKEATEVWGQVSDKVEKSWADLKTMVEGAMAPKGQPNNERRSQTSSRQLRDAPSTLSTENKIYNPVVVSELDGYSMADDDSAAKAQAESAATKIKGFLSNIGLNEDNQKKASDALTKAGSAVSDTVTKDLPVAFKKAGDAVSETVTKDIPNAFKNIFG